MNGYSRRSPSLDWKEQKPKKKKQKPTERHSLVAINCDKRPCPKFRKLSTSVPCGWGEEAGLEMAFSSRYCDRNSKGKHSFIVLIFRIFWCCQEEREGGWFVQKRFSRRKFSEFSAKPKLYLRARANAPLRGCLHRFVGTNLVFKELNPDIRELFPLSFRIAHEGRLRGRCLWDEVGWRALWRIFGHGENLKHAEHVLEQGFRWWLKRDTFIT